MLCRRVLPWQFDVAVCCWHWCSWMHFSLFFHFDVSFKYENFYVPIVLTGLCTQFVILNSAGLLTFIAINGTVFHIARAHTPFINKLLMLNERASGCACLSISYYFLLHICAIKMPFRCNVKITSGIMSMQAEQKQQQMKSSLILWIRRKGVNIYFD